MEYLRRGRLNLTDMFQHMGSQAVKATVKV